MNVVCLPAGKARRLWRKRLNVEKVTTKEIFDTSHENDPLGPKKSYRVLQTYENGLQNIVKLYLRVVETDREFFIRTSVGHRLYVLDHGFEHAQDVPTGARMINYNRQVVEVLAVELEPEPELVYNFEVEEAHTYFVGDDAEHAVLVHNQYGVPDKTLQQPLKTKDDQERIRSLLELMEQSETGKKMIPILYDKVDTLFRTGTIKGYYTYKTNRGFGRTANKTSFLGYDALYMYIGKGKYNIYIERMQTDLQAAALLVHELTHASGIRNETECYTNQLNFLKEMLKIPQYEKEAKSLIKDLLNRFGDGKGNIDKNKFTADGDYPRNFKKGKTTIIDGEEVTYSKITIGVPKTIVHIPPPNFHNSTGTL